MSVVFLKSACSEPARTEELFGLCDDQDNTKTYSNVDDPNKWIARVSNLQQQGVVFTPIDNCIIIYKDEKTKKKESTCDGMLTSANCLYLVELKDWHTGGWLSDAIDQLENTMKLLIAAHKLTSFKYKKAFACNKKNKSFRVFDNEQNLRFFRTYGFRIDCQKEIEIK